MAILAIGIGCKRPPWWCTIRCSFF